MSTGAAKGRHLVLVFVGTTALFWASFFLAHAFILWRYVK